MEPYCIFYCCLSSNSCKQIQASMLNLILGFHHFIWIGDYQCSYSPVSQYRTSLAHCTSLLGFYISIVLWTDSSVNVSPSGAQVAGSSGIRLMLLGQLPRYTSLSRLGPLHTRDWGPVTIHFKHSYWSKWRRRSPVYAWRTNGVRECKMDTKSTWIPTWHQMDRVWWSPGWFFFFSKSHLLEVGLTQNQETMALRNLTRVNLLYFIVCEDPTCKN